MFCLTPKSSMTLLINVFLVFLTWAYQQVYVLLSSSFVICPDHPMGRSLTAADLTGARVTLDVVVINSFSQGERTIVINFFSLPNFILLPSSLRRSSFLCDSQPWVISSFVILQVWVRKISADKFES